MSEGPSPEFARSFERPNFLTWLGARMTEHAKGYVCLELPVRPEFLQLLGAVHGGVIASVADAALACALLTETGPGVSCVTIEMKLNYVAPIHEGVLRGKGYAVHRSRRLGVSRADLYDGDDNLVATALGTFRLVQVPGSGNEGVPA